MHHFKTTRHEQRSSSFRFFRCIRPTSNGSFVEWTSLNLDVSNFTIININFKSTFTLCSSNLQSQVATISFIRWIRTSSWNGGINGPWTTDRKSSSSVKVPMKSRNRVYNFVNLEIITNWSMFGWYSESALRNRCSLGLEVPRASLGGLCYDGKIMDTGKTIVRWIGAGRLFRASLLPIVLTTYGM